MLTFFQWTESLPMSSRTLNDQKHVPINIFKCLVYIAAYAWYLLLPFTSIKASTYFHLLPSTSMEDSRARKPSSVEDRACCTAVMLTTTSCPTVNTPPVWPFHVPVIKQINAGETRPVYRPDAPKKTVERLSSEPACDHTAGVSPYSTVTSTQTSSTSKPTRMPPSSTNPRLQPVTGCGKQSMPWRCAARTFGRLASHHQHQ